MQKTFGILIRPDTHTVHDVDADQWTEHAMREKLQVGNGEFERREVERTGDTIVVSAFLNASTAGKASRSDGFDLYGERFYGPALIISGEASGTSPILDPHDISRAIHFFRLNHEDVTGAERYESIAAG